MSRTETLGRLYAAGFEVKEKSFIGNNLYFVMNKVKKPLFNAELRYGPILKMRRHGKNGKIIYVYKFRTMHAYSEFIQHYVYKKNNLAEGGKLKDDFRVSTLGKVFRKYWIDELPMIYNFLKGDLKLVGVRPLSAHYLGLYSQELKQKRIQHKPGLIPPFYVDMPKTLEEIQASEMKYLLLHEKNPVWTDVKYFFLACHNILIRKARSK
jgi:lipopolysaccharide/colanic/teichoic acid biosynthesis glycosyltransferase